MLQLLYDKCKLYNCLWHFFWIILYWLLISRTCYISNVKGSIIHSQSEMEKNSHQIRLIYRYGMQSPDLDGLYIWNAVTRLGWIIYMECIHQIRMGYTYEICTHQIRMGYTYGMQPPNKDGLYVWNATTK